MIPMAQKKITFYFRPMCGFCIAAERLLVKKGYILDKINVWTKPKAKETMIAKSGGRSTVPQIFADDLYIGDCRDIYDLEATGKLDPLLQRIPSRLNTNPHREHPRPMKA